MGISQVPYGGQDAVRTQGRALPPVVSRKELTRQLVPWSITMGFVRIPLHLLIESCNVFLLSRLLAFGNRQNVVHPAYIPMTQTLAIARHVGRSQEW